MISNFETKEHQRLANSEARKADWKNWGPYLSERAWGTVREDYSSDGEAWEYFPFHHAHVRTYRWNEDGLGGFCNRYQNICLAIAFWNEKDPILKERLFGLTGKQGNHGEDVKEYYFYLDSTPTHSYAKTLYKYPQVAYPYEQLVEKNKKLSRHKPEFELIDASRQAFQENRYFDIFIEYAKAGEEDILCRISALNRAPAPAPIHILPHIWYRNTWSWGYKRAKPMLTALNDHTVYTNHRYLGERWWYIDVKSTPNINAPSILFTENETNFEYLYHTPNNCPYVKDGIQNAVVQNKLDRVNPDRQGTKAAADFKTILAPGETFIVQVRFTNLDLDNPFDDFDDIITKRLQEADQFYKSIQNPKLTSDQANIQRQAFAGLMWTKQFYHYSVDLWLEGDPVGPAPPSNRKAGRNQDWKHLYNLDVISMPDKWEYPWYAAWDLAFHTLPIAIIDPEWAKRQLILMLREWYMHPNGQIPAYEWSFKDVNPPVHAWAAWRVYQITRNVTGFADTVFLERVFQKLLLNFTWWVNRKDKDENNVFQGGFLGLDNIGVFDRSAPLPMGGHLEQADGTAWMGMYCLNMLAIALELARTRPAYEDMATKFFEHFIYIANAINTLYGGNGLWNEEDGFYYDQIHCPDGHIIPLKIRSFVGLIPLYAVEIIDSDLLDKLPRFKRRMDWFIEYRPHLVENIASLTRAGTSDCRLLSLVNEKQLKRIMVHMLDEDKFLSTFGLRSLSKEHEKNPFTFSIDGQTHKVSYVPGESTTGLFGGNSNWRGPIWFPVNFLMIETLQKFHRYYGNTLSFEYPTGSTKKFDLQSIANQISHHLIKIFQLNSHGRRPFWKNDDIFHFDLECRDNILFHEYFHGDSGKGLGASHQTGWTALIACLLQDFGNPYPLSTDNPKKQ